MKTETLEIIEKKKSSFFNLETCRFLGVKRITDKNMEMVEKWKEWGFSEEMLAFARDLNIESTGKFNIKYTHKILLEWQRAGIFTLEEAKKNKIEHNQKIASERRNKKKKSKAEEAVLQKEKEPDPYLSLINQFDDDDE